MKIPLKFKKRGRYKPNISDKKYWFNLYNKGYTCSEISKLTGWTDRHTISHGIQDIGGSIRDYPKRLRLVWKRHPNKFIVTYELHSKYYIPFKNNPEKMPINEAIAYIIGAWLGDGRKVFPNRGLYFRIKVSSKKFAFGIKNLIEKTFIPIKPIKINIIDRSKESPHYAKQYQILIKNNNLMNRIYNATNKGTSIPNEIFNSGDNIKYSFLAGLIDSDGSFYIAVREYKKGTFSYAVRCETNISSKNALLKEQLKSLTKVGFIDKDSWRIYSKKEVFKHKKILTKLLPYLILKKPQAKLLLQAIEIWSKERTKYDYKNFNELLIIKNKLSKLNVFGYKQQKNITLTRKTIL